MKDSGQTHFGARDPKWSWLGDSYVREETETHSAAVINRVGLKFEAISPFGKKRFWTLAEAVMWCNLQKADKLTSRQEMGDLADD